MDWPRQCPVTSLARAPSLLPQLLCYGEKSTVLIYASTLAPICSIAVYDSVSGRFHQSGSFLVCFLRQQTSPRVYPPIPR